MAEQVYIYNKRLVSENRVPRVLGCGCCGSTCRANLKLLHKMSSSSTERVPGKSRRDERTPTNTSQPTEEANNPQHAKKPNKGKGSAPATGEYNDLSQVNDLLI